MKLNNVLRTERVFSCRPQKIFMAFEEREKLAKWWGPKDFTNTFDKFEFRPGGKWIFTMHAPNGVNYPNENVFREIEPDHKIVIEHVGEPHFILTVTLTPQGDKTLLSWEQVFDDEEMAERLRSICVPANEQNLDRLGRVLEG